MDRLTPQKRSAVMAKIKGTDTRPEIAVRQIAHGMGLRFRLHRRDLPGTPDLVFPNRKAVVFVHGCFWHQHWGCPKATIPRARPEFWGPKLARNVERDAESIVSLQKCGWKVLIIWECQTRDLDFVRESLHRFFPSHPPTSRPAASKLKLPSVSQPPRRAPSSPAGPSSR
jgi:DNA mismatch endonuclease, patch repair protein